jgi:DNA ligase D-like protein (predicted ligase)
MLQQTALRFIPPMLPTLVQEPPSGDKWLHEIKHDGYRTQLVLGGSDGRAFTRNGLDWSDCYRFVLKDAQRLHCSSAVIDGEIILQDEQGRADFDNLKSAISRTPERLIFYAFDLMMLDGSDLRHQTVLNRRSRLQELTGEHDPGSRIQFSEHVIGCGPEFFQRTCAMELEGIVSKKVTSRYCSGRSRAWLKTKAFVEEEFVVVGCDRNEGGPPFALLASELNGSLEYVGSAFVTLEESQRELFWRTVERLGTKKPAIAVQSRTASWVRPELRVRAKHLRCSGKLRHATLVKVIRD